MLQERGGALPANGVAPPVGGRLAAWRQREDPDQWRRQDDPLQVVGSPSMPSASSSASPTPRKDAKRFPKHLVEIYDIDRMLARGASSTVWRCVHRATQQVRAIKKIDSSEVPAREIAHEVAFMRLLRHDCVVRCYDVFLEAQYVNIVVDMFPGGDLIDGLNAHRASRGRLPDQQLARLARQMVAAVAHVHSRRIVHRDIKGENFLSDRPDIGDRECRVALADFGTAKRIEPGEKLRDRLGTTAFWAPEVFRGQSDFLVDVWAIGVTAFILLTGELPFTGEADICRHVPEASNGGSPKSPVKLPFFTSSGCQDFIARCLVKDCALRPNANGISRLDWVSGRLPSEGDNAPIPLRVPTKEEVSRTAGAVVGGVLDVVGAVLMGCFSGVGLCIDLLLAGGEAAQPSSAARLPAAQGQEVNGAPSHVVQGHVVEPVVEKDAIERQVVELERRISSNSLRIVAAAASWGLPASTSAATSKTPQHLSW